MTDDTNLEGAYALKTPEDTKRLYAAWADTYDSDFGAAQGYLTPREVVRVFVGAGGCGPVLDVGAGTGLVGEGLAAVGVGPIDALDQSEDMLRVAKGKGAYRDLIAADVTQPLGLTGYRGIVSAGTFTRFCRKFFGRLTNSLLWTQLCCEGCELLECRDACLG